MAEPQTTGAIYKPLPPGYRGWSCGTDANGECLCGEPAGIEPSMEACPHAVLVPDVPETTDAKREKVGCGFCGKPERDVFFLLRGPITNICDECVELITLMIAEKRSAAQNAR